MARSGSRQDVPARRVIAVGLLLVALAACTGDGPTDRDAATPSDTSPTTSTSSGTTTGAPPALRDARRCPAVEGFTCATLSVPLDHRAPGGRSLGLRVATADGPADSRGTLLFLTGGPGQPGVPSLGRITRRLAPVLEHYRLVMLDQRGTGSGALRCPALQKQLGTSDLFVPSRSAVRGCAERIGADRRFFGTSDTVADLDLLRRALGVRRWVIDGVSYGTFVAAHYAIAHPDHVERLVLDSVVPHTGVDPFLRVPLHATGRVLRDVCRESGCAGDPAADLHRVVTERSDGSDILNAITIAGIVDPSYPGILGVLRDAARGDPSGLEALLDGVRSGVQVPPGELSQGLHAAALCADGPWPWAPDASATERAAAVRRAARRIAGSEVYPFDLPTATGNGILRTCQWWPAPTGAPLPRPSELPAVPTLLLGGGHDLSTPIEWLRQQEAMTPDATVLVVHAAGHSLQSRSDSPRVIEAVLAFLTAA